MLSLINRPARIAFRPVRGRRLLPALLALLGGVALPPAAAAADFGFSVVIRAGAASAPGQWEIAIGAPGAPGTRTSIFPYYFNGIPYNFDIGYTQATNTAYVRFFNLLGITHVLTDNPAGGSIPSPAIQWDFPAADFYVRAARRGSPSSVTLDQLSLSGSLSVLQPLSTTTLTAAQNNSPAATASLGSPVVFRTNTAAGDWLLSGRVQFTGTSWGGGGASGNALVFGFSGFGTRINQVVPEPVVWISMAGGLIVLGVARRRQSINRGQEPRS